MRCVFVALTWKHRCFYWIPVPVHWFSFAFTPLLPPTSDWVTDLNLLPLFSSCFFFSTIELQLIDTFLLFLLLLLVRHCWWRCGVICISWPASSLQFSFLFPATTPFFPFPFQVKSISCVKCHSQECGEIRLRKIRRLQLCDCISSSECCWWCWCCKVDDECFLGSTEQMRLPFLFFSWQLFLLFSFFSLLLVPLTLTRTLILSH